MDDEVKAQVEAMIDAAMKDDDAGARVAAISLIAGAL